MKTYHGYLYSNKNQIQRLPCVWHCVHSEAWRQSGKAAGSVGRCMDLQLWTQGKRFYGHLFKTTSWAMVEAGAGLVTNTPVNHPDPSLKKTLSFCSSGNRKVFCLPICSFKCLRSALKVCSIASLIPLIWQDSGKLSTISDFQTLQGII